MALQTALPARNRFLLPLKAEIVSENFEAASQRWQRFGGPDAIVEACIVQLCQDEKIGRHDLDPRHLQKLGEYVHTFDLAMSDWMAKSIAAKTHQEAPIEIALRALMHEDVDRERPQAAALRDMLRELGCAEAAGESGSLPADFGSRCSPGTKGQVVINEPANFVTPLMLAGWPNFVAEIELPLTSMLLDRLRMMHGVGPSSIPEAIEFYLARGLFRAAERAAIGQLAWEEMVATAYEAQRASFIEQNRDLLEEAQDADDPDLKQYLSVIKYELDGRNLDDASAWLDELRSQLYLYRRRNDPKRQALIALLQEAGEDVAEDSSTEELAARLDGLRRDADAQERRLHLSVLGEMAGRSGLPDALRRTASPWPGNWIDLGYGLQQTRR